MNRYLTSFFVVLLAAGLAYYKNRPAEIVPTPVESTSATASQPAVQSSKTTYESPTAPAKAQETRKKKITRINTEIKINPETGRPHSPYDSMLKHMKEYKQTSGNNNYKDTMASLNNDDDARRASVASRNLYFQTLADQMKQLRAGESTITYQAKPQSNPVSFNEIKTIGTTKPASSKPEIPDEEEFEPIDDEEGDELLDDDQSDEENTDIAENLDESLEEEATDEEIIDERIFDEE